MAQYKSHTNKTIRQMKHALYWIHQTKRVLKNVRQIDTMIRAGKSGHFNFLKGYIMSHYPKQIKYYRSATIFTTDIWEAMHITWIKDFFKQTNMKKSYKKQILDQNVKKFSLMVRDDINMFFSTETLTDTDKMLHYKSTL